MIDRDSFFKELQNMAKYYHPYDITNKFKFTYWPVGNYDGKMKSLRTFTVHANDIIMMSNLSLALLFLIMLFMKSLS